LERLEHRREVRVIRLLKREERAAGRDAWRRFTHADLADPGDLLEVSEDALALGVYLRRQRLEFRHLRLESGRVLDDLARLLCDLAAADVRADRDQPLAAEKEVMLL